MAKLYPVIQLSFLFLTNWGPCSVLHSPVQQALASVLVIVEFLMVDVG